jgi:alpha/beta superfamily hydrolase
VSTEALFRPPVPEAVEIPGPVGLLEARAELPESDAAPRVVGVVCHPHPLYGGTMQNKVVHTLARAFQELGAPTVRFNFRGVGASAGTHDEGRGEVDDALAVVEWARSRWNCDALWLAGFSFGAAVALHANPRARPAALVTVAPPVKRLPIELSAAPECPWLIVQGDRDELVAYQDVVEWSRPFVPPAELATITGGEHFFHGRLGDLRTAVGEFLRVKGGSERVRRDGREVRQP